jgi:DNA helicase-2/ATP-dependent DNA helicase PcrA
LRSEAGVNRSRRYGGSVDAFDGLNSEQRRAAETVSGPVCILAGAGSGKTTTITRRIAWQVVSGAFRPDQILAVTFTDKAAGVMKERLASLGASGVEARTFHSAALAQLYRYDPDAVGRILPTKAVLLRQIANALPPPYRFRPAGDLATEVERAKASRVPPGEYLGSLEGHEPPIPANLMYTVYREYERRKAQHGAIDFEDVLELASRMLESDAQVRADVRNRYRALTVDEYQDVNLLQQTLLDLWLGPSDDLCVVGDDYQSIYGFTGASPGWLLGFADRFPNVTVARLEENYRSTQEVLALANRLVPRLEGAPKLLRATRGTGPEPALRGFATAEAEGAWLVDEIRGAASAGVPLDGIAILCRTNARLADFEELLHEAGLPFQGSSLLARDAARRLLRHLDGDGSTGVARRVRRLAVEAGWLGEPPDRVGERELTRQADLGRLVQLAEDADDGALTCVGFAAELRRRYESGDRRGKGVHLLTYHRAKGLEFHAVFLPRLEVKELPSRLARTPEEQAEERRLLYVGITRAKHRVAITWSQRPSPFLAELGATGPSSAAAPTSRERPEKNRSPAAEELRRWRLERARADSVPPYVIFPDRTIDELLARRPSHAADLSTVHGLGPARLARFGEDLFALVERLQTQAGTAPPAQSATRDVIPPPAAPPPVVGSDAGGPGNSLLYDALVAWRRARAAEAAVPPYHVFANRVLAAIATREPRSREDLLEVPGVGPAKLERYSDEVLELVERHAPRLSAVA